MKKIFKGRNVLVTGHTGFKGAWLSLWLNKLNANVTGISLPPENIRGNLYQSLELNKIIDSRYCDIGDYSKLKEIIIETRPEIVFHLAAQPIVLSSYEDPINNYRSNVMGTLNLLESLRYCDSVKTILAVTTDKCYQNNEWVWPYREDDKLGGIDPYSASKAMTEILVNSHKQSFFEDKGIGVATARAGNVIGGGDFAKYRIIPDIVESIEKNQQTIIRNPYAIRPWQHVFDALNGYLTLCSKLDQDPKQFSKAYNFGPDNCEKKFNVQYITELFINKMKRGSFKIVSSEFKHHEAKILRLDSSRAKEELNWSPKWSTEKAIEETANWFQAYLIDPKANCLKLSQDHLDKFTENLIE